MSNIEVKRGERFLLLHSTFNIRYSTLIKIIFIKLLIVEGGGIA